MGLFRRSEPLHERLAREGGLGTQPLPEAGPPGWVETGIHGVQRPREWDTVVTVEVEGIEGDRALFVALPDNTLVIEEGEEVDALADALDGVLAPPYRAEAARQAENRWAVGLRRIEVVELRADPEGEEVSLTVRDGERTLLVDGASTFGTIPELEALGAARGPSYVVQGRRLSGTLWEVQVAPL